METKQKYFPSGQGTEITKISKNGIITINVKSTYYDKIPLRYQ